MSIIRSLESHYICLFVNKKEEDGKTNRYFYLGEVDVLHYEGNKPITMQLQFHEPLPYDLYEDLVIKV